MSSGLEVETLEGGALRRVRLATPPANILDEAKVGALREVLREAADERHLKAILLEAAGPHFSYGASVEEHLPGRFESMIAAFHALVREMAESEIVWLAAVRGRCLGGGLELVALCDRIFAAPDAGFGQPEIALGVFAPVASVVLAERVGRGHAEALCLGGETVGAEEACRWGLVDETADDPAAAALAWARRCLLPRSAAALRLAVRAARTGLARRIRDDLPAVERLYLEELMSTRDAVEGLEAFLAKRPPVWEDR
ncbi:MAG: enoyl-CoA hydratase/isomerase family protein [Thermoanaerobaculia bacterium]